MKDANLIYLKHRYGKLFFAISEILFMDDPIGINYETNTDEYESEVGTILPRLTSAWSVEDVHNIVYEEFVRWFGEEEAGPKDTYGPASAHIWLLWSSISGRA